MLYFNIVGLNHPFQFRFKIIKIHFIDFNLRKSDFYLGMNFNFDFIKY
jgi:hypothetical protein